MPSGESDAAGAEKAGGGEAEGGLLQRGAKRLRRTESAWIHGICTLGGGPDHRLRGGEGSGVLLRGSGHLF